MKPQRKRKVNKKPLNYEKAAIIQFELKKRRLKQKDIALELNLSESIIHDVIYGRGASSKVSNWIYEKLGVRA